MIADLPLILITWLVFFLWQLIGFSWTFRFYKNKFYDSAWGFGRLITWLILSTSVWFLAHLGLPVNQSAFFYLLFLGLSINSALYYEKSKKQIFEFFRKKWKLIIIQELLFLLFFVFLCVVRGHQPRVEGLEKFMDVGFIAGYLRSPTLPAEDMWLAGEKINYYTFGHYLGSVTHRFLNVEVEVSYNLLLGLVMGLVAIQAASFSGNLVYSLSEYRSKINSKNINYSSLIKAAIFGGLLLVLAGNGHSTWYLLKNKNFKGYWYPDATRFIERTIHEFPAYSFVVSDLHAHVWSMPIVIFILLNIYLWIDILLNQNNNEFLLLPKDKKRQYNFNLIELLDTKATDCLKAFLGLLKNVLNIFTIKKIHKQPFFIVSLFIGFLLGITISTSTWDFLVYSMLLSVSGLIVLISNRQLLWQLMISALTMIAVSILTALPWLLNFASISEGMAFANEHSPFWQLVVLWLPHLLLSVLAMVSIFQLIKKNGKVNSRETMIVAMVISAIVLLILPELIYMKDIYPNHPRANTMFKLTFQAFLMMTLVISAFSGIVSTYKFKKQFSVSQQLITKILIMVFVLSTGYYSFFGYRDFYGGLKKYQGINGLSWLELSDSNDYEAINWLRKNVDGRPVILEAVGESYTTYARVSTFTGLPTVLGWRVHEWLWRGGFDIPAKRTEEVKSIYLDPLSDNSAQLIDYYRVKYIFIGSKEREAYKDLDESGLSKLGDVVFSSGDTKIIGLD